MKVKLFLLLLLPLLFIGCGKQPPINTGNTGKLNVLVSIAPYKKFVERISGDSLNVTTLLPKNANLHTFEPTPRLSQNWQNVDLWITVGAEFESQIKPALCEVNPNMVVLDLSKKITPMQMGKETHSLLPCKHTHTEDIHMWLGPKDVPAQIRVITEALIQLDSSMQTIFLEGMNALIADLERLDRSISVRLLPFQGSALIVSHPSLGYFCKDYQLKQISIECEGKSPAPQDLQKILKSIEKETVLCVISQEGFDSKGARLISEKLSLPLISFDPYAYDYFLNMETLSTQIISNKSPKK
ncbi:MAG: zinc ABC transporter substrate-binding protein [Simkaniaceae bacterium]